MARASGLRGRRVAPSHTLPRAREWGNPVSPFPHLREGLGGLRPPRNNLIFIPSVCGGAAWTAEVTIVRRVQPPSQPPPAGGRRRVPAPSGGGSGQGRSPCPRRRGAGGTPALPGRFHRAWCAMRMTVSREHRLLEQGCGETRFPHALAPQGNGETGFPHFPTCERVWEGFALPGSMFIPSVCGASRMDG